MKRFALWTASVGLWALAAPQGSGQGLFIERPGRTPGVTQPSGPRLPMTGLRYDVEARDAHVEVSIEQTFHNHTGRVLEGVYLFPIPKGATADKFELWMNGQPVQAEVLKKEKATEVYESIVRRARDPGLLEYVGDDLLRARIFPIQPHQDAKVRMHLVWTAERVGDLFACDLPLSVPEGSPKTTLTFKASSTTTLGPVFSPTHTLDVVRQGDDSALASWEGDSPGEGAWARIYYGTGGDEPTLSLLAHRRGGAGHFLLTLFAPKPEDGARLPRDVVFLLDRSGSMKDGKLEQAVAALKHGFATLRPEDRFEVITFATGTRATFGGWTDATPEHVARAGEALASVRASGGTALSDGLEQALALPRDDDRLSVVVLLTDGEPTVGETELPKILGRCSQLDPERRVFSIGLGHDVNAKLLDALSDQHRGVSDYVLPKENLEVRVSAFFDRVSEPALRDAEITIDGVEAHDVFPKKLGDLYAASAVHLLGRYDLAGTATLTLRGKTRAGSYEKTHTVAFPKEETDHESLRALYASRKVAFLLREIRRHGANDELREEITRLGREYGIVTPWTSALAVEDGEIVAAAQHGGWFRGPGDTVPNSFDRFGVQLDALGYLEEDELGAIRLGGGGGLRDAAGEARGGLPPASRSLRAESVEFEALRKAEVGEKAVLYALELQQLAGDSKGQRGSELKRARGTDRGYEIVRREGRDFLHIGPVWIDRAMKPEQWDARREIVAYSDDYFALLRETPSLRKVFALGDHVVVVHGDQVLVVVPEATTDDG